MQGGAAHFGLDSIAEVVEAQPCRLTVRPQLQAGRCWIRGTPPPLWAPLPPAPGEKWWPPPSPYHELLAVVDGEQVRSGAQRLLVRYVCLQEQDAELPVRLVEEQAAE